MVEAKTQIRVFEEIEEIGHNHYQHQHLINILILIFIIFIIITGRDPPECCSIYSYGGAPVKCDYLIIPPEDSLYFGSKYLFRVVFLPGYPFKIPDTFLFNRFVL